MDIQGKITSFERSLVTFSDIKGNIKMKNTDLILSFNRAFLGAISKEIRAITYNFIENTLEVFVYLDIQPTEENYEMVDMAITEVLAEFPEIMFQRIQLIEYTAPLSTLNNENCWFFRRYEGL